MGIEDDKLPDILDNIPAVLPHASGLRIGCQRISQFPDAVSRLLQSAADKQIFVDTIVIHLMPDDHYELLAWGEVVTGEQEKEILKLLGEGYEP